MADLKDKYVHETYHKVLNVGTSGTSGFSGSLQRITDGDGNLSPLSLSTSHAGLSLANYADDSAAAAGGIPVGGLYHTNGVVKVRIL